MLFEAETLQGAIRKATLDYKKSKIGTRRGGKPVEIVRPVSRVRPSTEVFGDHDFGDIIPGTGSSGYSSSYQAVRAASREMISLARQTYPERVNGILRGESTRSVMIPELAAAIEVSDWRLIGETGATYSYAHLTAGERSRTGAGRFEVRYTANLTAIVHAHWLDNSPSGPDDTNKRRAISNVAHARGLKRSEVDVNFYIYSIRGGLIPY